MKIRCFPAAVLVTATFALWAGHPTSVLAQGPTPPAAPAPPEKVQLSSGAEEVLKLTRAKINDDITVAFVQSANRRFNLSANEIVYLRQAGVSDRVLTAMLSPQAPVTAEPPPPPPAAAEETSLASAPQYITSPTTTYVETVPSSTVYLATTPAYYSFYDPWPYWSSWYPYPYFSFGFYWGNYWNYGYCNNAYWNNYCHYGNPPPPPPNGNPPPPNGNRPPPPNGNGNPPAINGRSGGQPGTFASDGRQVRGVSQPVPGATASRSESRLDGTGSIGRTTSTWGNNGTQPAATRTSSSQANATVGRQTARPTLGNSGVNTRTTTGRPNPNPSGDQLARGNYNPSPTSVWSSNSRQETASRTAVNQNPTTSARPSRASTSPTTVWSRSSSPATPRYSASPTASYQRSSASPSYSYRPSGSAANFSRPSSPSFSRPSMPSASPNFGSASSFRGGGGFSGASPARMSSGGSRGGGGGGRGR